MSTWTEEQLRDAVSRKGNLKATTDIICKFFLDAVSSHPSSAIGRVAAVLKLAPM